MYIEMNTTEKTTPKDFINTNVLEDIKEFKVDGEEELVGKALNTSASSNYKTCRDQQLGDCKTNIEPDRKVQIRQRLSNAQLLNKYVSEHSESFESDGKELFCKICKKNISFDTKHLVYRHLQSKKHNKMLNDKSVEIENQTQRKRKFIVELLNKYVSEYTDAFETDGESLLCKLCKKSIAFHKRSSVERHLKTQKHLNCYAQKYGKSALNADYKNITEANNWEKNEDFCRTCLKQFSNTNQKDSKQSITETPAGYQNNTSIMEILENIQPQIKVELTVDLPTLMCSDCIQKLMVSYEFIEMYRKVDKKLRKMLEEFDINNSHNNLVESQECLDEMEVVPADFEPDKCEIEFEQVNIDGLEKEDIKSDNELPEFKDERKPHLSNDEENNETVFSNPYSDDASDDDWMPKKSFPSSDDATKKVFKGFTQPDKNDDGSVTCQLCKSVFDGVISWRDHIRQKHLVEKPRRTYNRRTDTPKQKESQKVRRKIQPNEDGLYKCEYCEKTYPRYIFYRRHLRVHTQEPFLCIECGKSFPLSSSYTSHMLRHKGEKNFKCPHCPKSFVCQSGLYNHAITHTNNKPYVCDICGSAFHMAYQLKKHNRIHTGVKKYQCEYCDMRFITSEKQRRHMRTHTGEKPYRCKYCERAFAQSNDCVKHLRQHLGDNVYQCDLCPIRFPLLRELRVHFASHKDDDEETRARNLQARKEAEKNLQIKLGSKETT